MKILAISGSYQRQRTIAKLIEEASRGIRAVAPEAHVEVIRLVDRHIEYCRGCMTCHNDDPGKPLATCPIQDDMADICRQLDAADGYIFACPVYEGSVTAIMKCFFERTCWVMARPGRWPLKGCPEPRNPKRKAAICILSTGMLPPWITRLFGSVVQIFKDCIPCTYHAPIIGTLYACGVGIEKPAAPQRHLPAAFKLGAKLARQVQRLA